MIRNTVLGILAHVDAGKTTLSESILYRTGTIRRRGRVDHGDAFLDTDEMEKKRGITIYSKLARFKTADRPFTILDTPGHADFSPETERALRVMDEAILVISAPDVLQQQGADPQVRTLWRLLQHYGIPTFLFLNKMDQLTGSDTVSGTQAQPDNSAAPLRAALLHFLQKDLESRLVLFDEKQLNESNEEAVVVCSDELMEKVLEGGHVTDSDVAALISERQLFPVYCGSALLDQGTDALLEGLRRYTATPADFSPDLRSADSDSSLHSADSGRSSAAPPSEGSGIQTDTPVAAGSSVPPAADAVPFGAIVYKITRDSRTRLTWMKITGGTLSIRDSIREVRPGADTSDSDDSAAAAGSDFSNKNSDGRDTNHSLSDNKASGSRSSDHSLSENAVSGMEDSDSSISEKVTEIRLYSGGRYTSVTTVSAGEIAAVAGLSYTKAGDGLGTEASDHEELLAPIQTSAVTATDRFGKTVDNFTLMKALRSLEEQEPMLHVEQDEHTRDVNVSIMGQVQIEILKNLLLEQYGLRAEFGPGTIVYKETIRRPVEGVGHFEPLRHYAEVHLLLEPGEPGSGLIFENHCPPDTLDRNWQNLIMTHLREHRHRGVLTGSDITDMRISLIGGRASRKHTSGGDFRKATYAAVRQGLMMAENILLEPVLSIRLEIPSSSIGRAMTDISRMNGRTRPAELTPDGNAILEGTVPASELGDYPRTVAGYTGGSRTVSLSLKGYEPCHNAREIIEKTGYDPDTDRRNPTWSVFCSHGAGTIVPWDRVRDFMQLDTGWTPAQMEQYDGPILTDDYYTYTAQNTDDFEIDRPGNAAGPGGENSSSSTAHASTLPADSSGLKADNSSAGRSAGPNADITGNAEQRMSRQTGHSARRKPSDDFKKRQAAFYAGEEELRRIFEKTYGPIRQNLHHPENEPYYQKTAEGLTEQAAADAEPDQKAPDTSPAGSSSSAGISNGIADPSGRRPRRERPKAAGHTDLQEFLLVDGYNIIFAWEELKELAAVDIKAARDRLLDILSDYAGYSGLNVIVVFDAYKVPGGRGEVYRYHNIDVVYTKEAETADLYIEKTAHRLVKNHLVTVATGDQVEQVIIFGAGAIRLSPRGLLENILLSAQDMRERFLR